MTDILGSHWEGCWRAHGHHECAIGKVEELQLRVANLDHCLRASLAREAALEKERDEREASRVSWDTLRRRPDLEAGK